MRGFGWIPAIAYLAAGAAGAMAVAALDDDRGIRTWLRLQRDLTAAEQRIAEISRDIELHRAELAALTEDDFALERAIREELRYARAGETVVRLRPESLATPRND